MRNRTRHPNAFILPVNLQPAAIYIKCHLPRGKPAQMRRNRHGAGTRATCQRDARTLALGGQRQPHPAFGRAETAGVVDQCQRAGGRRHVGGLDVVLQQNGQAAQGAVRDGPPVRRQGRVEDIAAAVAYLASEEAGFVTGAALDVNGGQAMSI